MIFASPIDVAVDNGKRPPQVLHAVRAGPFLLLARRPCGPAQFAAQLAHVLGSAGQALSGTASIRFTASSYLRTSRDPLLLVARGLFRVTRTGRQRCRPAISTPRLCLERETQRQKRTERRYQKQNPVSTAAYMASGSERRLKPPHGAPAMARPLLLAISFAHKAEDTAGQSTQRQRLPRIALRSTRGGRRRGDDADAVDCVAADRRTVTDA